jgi:hypothetical protein
MLGDTRLRSGTSPLHRHDTASTKMETLVDPGCDRCDVTTALVLPSACPFRSTFPGFSCATKLRIGGRTPRWYASPVRLGRPATPPATRLPATNAGYIPRLCPSGPCEDTVDGDSGHTRLATVPPLAARCPYGTAVAARWVPDTPPASPTRFHTLCQPGGRIASSEGPKRRGAKQLCRCPAQD